MQAALMYGPNDIRVEEIDRPECPEGGFVLKVMAVGLCGSDIRNLTTDSKSGKYPHMRSLGSLMKFLLPAKNITSVTAFIFIPLITVCSANHAELVIVKCVRILEII